MKKVFFAVSAALLVLTVNAQSWTLDKAHSKLGFAVTHLLVSNVEGKFKNFDLSVVSEKPDFSDAKVTLTADVSSINTENDYRDNDLKSDKFFDAQKLPTLTFTSTSIKKVDAKNYKLAGNLTMHGVTKPVVLDLILNGVVENPMNKKTVAGFKLKGEIKRTDFGIAPSFPAAVVSDEVAIDANIELNK